MTWTLRARLVLVVGALSALAVIVANTAGLLLIRIYLGDRIDEQLTQMARPLASASPPGGALVPRARFFRVGPGQVMYVYSRNGALDTTRSSTRDASRPDAPPVAEVADRAAAGRLYTATAGDGTGWRLLALPLGATGELVVIGSSLLDVQQTTERLLLIDAGVLVLVLGLLAAVAAVVVRLGLRPLTAMEHAASDISAGNLSVRVSGPDPRTEPGRLGLALNGMLDRTETEVDARTASEQRLRQFVADASHELRTPLTSIRGFAELYRRGGAPPGEVLDETMARIEGEAGRMGVLEVADDGPVCRPGTRPGSSSGGTGPTPAGRAPGAAAPGWGWPSWPPSCTARRLGGAALATRRRCGLPGDPARECSEPTPRFSRSSS